MEDLRVAVVAMTSAVGRPRDNLARMEGFVREAAAQKARMICFPELSVSGYTLRPGEAASVETIPGPATEALGGLAERYGMTILAGLVEEAPGGGLFISHVAVGPDRAPGVYRKTHLGPGEEGVYTAGAACPVFCCGQTAFGIALCFDGHFPELFTLLALAGAEVVFVPHASPRETAAEKRARWLRYLAARAYDNGLYVAACNQVGPGEGGLRFSGSILVLGPRGEVLATERGRGEDMVVVDLSAEALRQVRTSDRAYFFARRRPHLYKPVAAGRPPA